MLLGAVGLAVGAARPAAGGALTYPGDWITVAATAEVVAEHFAALCKRYSRAWGEELIGPWKKEFQRRGAPHLHISTTPPMGFTTITDPATGARREADFKTWLSITWPTS